MLSVSGVQGAGTGQGVYADTVTFPYPDTTAGHSSSAIEAAGRDLAVYTSLYYQLTDPLGMGATITASLTGQPANLTADQWNALLSWLFTGSPSIYAFLSARAAGDVSVPSPVTHAIGLPLAASQLAASQIVELTVDLTIRRTGGVVWGELASSPAIRSATTRVPAVTTSGETGDPLGLTEFARDFEFALSSDGYWRKVAVGIDRVNSSAADPGAALWSVRIGTAPGQPISYAVTDVGRPHLFAPRPISNELQSHEHVPIYDYTTGTGISQNPSRKLNFADVDMDVWSRMLLGAVDEVLTPEFTAPMQIVAEHQGTDWLEKILDCKSALATAVSKWMIPLYADDTTSASAVQESYYQQLLSRLSAAYDIKAGIQFTASVAADPSVDGLPPQLFGAVRDLRAEDAQRSEITLTSPKLELAPVPAVSLPILMGAPDVVHLGGAEVGAVELSLRWEPSAIEHQIAQPAGIEGYLASSWLSFVLPDDSLTAALGTCTVPIVLRAFPAGPALTTQVSEQTHADAADLAALTKWTFSFTWSLPFHYVQDRVHGRVEFNVTPKQLAEAAPDLFAALAEFVTVYPHVRADLDTILAPIDATTPPDPRRFGDASVALGSLVQLVTAVTAAAATPDGLALAPRAADAACTAAEAGGAAPADTAATEYVFEVAEGATDEGYLLVTVLSGTPTGGGAPVVGIPGYEAVPYGPDEPDRHRYVYTDVGDSGVYLSQADGQQIADRTLILPDLDVLQRQDAWASVWVTRNERIGDGPPLAAPFVYTTAHTRFAEPLAPTIHADAVIDIARVGPDGPYRTLHAHLSALFDALFADVPESVSQALIGVETRYAYRLLPDGDPIELPVFFQPPRSIVISEPGATLPKMIDYWSAVISEWQAQQSPATDGARLHFDLLIMSDLTGQSMPLLRLRNLELAITDIAGPPQPD